MKFTTDNSAVKNMAICTFTVDTTQHLTIFLTCTFTCAIQHFTMFLTGTLTYTIHLTMFSPAHSYLHNTMPNNAFQFLYAAQTS